MADIDIDPFGEHELRPEDPTDEHIPLDLVTPGSEGVQTWEPSREQETSFGGPKGALLHGGRSGTSILHKEYLVGKIYELIGNKMHQRLEPKLSLFILGEDGRLYYIEKPQMNRNRELKTIDIGNQRTSRDGLQHNQNELETSICLRLDGKTSRTALHP